MGYAEHLQKFKDWEADPRWEAEQPEVRHTARKRWYAELETYPEYWEHAKREPQKAAQFKTEFLNKEVSVPETALTQTAKEAEELAKYVPPTPGVNLKDVARTGYVAAKELIGRPFTAQSAAVAGAVREAQPDKIGEPSLLKRMAAGAKQKFGEVAKTAEPIGDMNLAAQNIAFEDKFVEQHPIVAAAIGTIIDATADAGTAADIAKLGLAGLRKASPTITKITKPALAKVVEAVKNVPESDLAILQKGIDDLKGKTWEVAPRPPLEGTDVAKAVAEKEGVPVATLPEDIRTAEAVKATELPNIGREPTKVYELPTEDVESAKRIMAAIPEKPVKQAVEAPVMAARAGEEIVKDVAPEARAVEAPKPAEAPTKPLGGRSNIQKSIAETLMPSAKVTQEQSDLLAHNLKMQEKASRVAYKEGVNTARGEAVNKINDLISAQKIRLSMEREGAKLSEAQLKETAAQKLLREKEFGKIRLTMADEAAKQKASQLQDTKKALVSLVKESIPDKKVQAKYLQTVASVNSPRQMISLYQRVMKDHEKILTNSIGNQIVETYRRIQDSPSVHVDIKSKAGAYFSQYASALAKKSDRYKWDSNKLYSLLDDLEGLEQSGREALADFRAAKELSVNESLADFAKQKAYRSSPTMERVVGIGEENTTMMRWKNGYRRAAELARQKLWEAPMPMDVLFDMFDGGKQYQGAHMRHFKIPLDRAWASYRNEFDEIKDATDALVKKLNLDNRSLNRVGAYAILKQEEVVNGQKVAIGWNRLLESGYTPDEIADLWEKGLSDSERTFYGHIRGELDKMYPRINGVLRRVANRELPQVDDYFPFHLDWDKAEKSALRVDEQLGFNIADDGTVTKTPVPSAIKRTQAESGFTLARLPKAKTPVQINAYKVFMNHVRNATYFVNTAEPLQKSVAIANSEQYLSSAGDVAQKYVKDWINVVARNGGPLVPTQGFDTVLNEARKNVGAATLLYKASTLLLQPTAILNAFPDLGRYAAIGANDVTASRIKGMARLAMREKQNVADDISGFILRNFPEVRDRVIDDPYLSEILAPENRDFFSKVRRATSEFGAKALQAPDGWAAQSTVWGAYRKYLDEHNLPVNLLEFNKDAGDYALRVMRRTQASMFDKDLSPIMSQGAFSGRKSIDRMIFQFQNYSHQAVWARLAYDAGYQGALKGNFKNAAKITLWAEAAILAGIGMRHVSDELTGGEYPRERPEFPGYDDPEKLKKWKDKMDSMDDSLLERMFVENATSVPFAGNMVTSWMFKGKGAPVLTAGLAVFDPEASALKRAKGLTALGGVAGSAQVLQMIQKQAAQKKIDDKKRKKLLKEQGIQEEP